MCSINAYQGKLVDLDIKNIHLSVSHFTALAFKLLIGLQVGAKPLQLKGPIWVVTIIHLVQACNRKTLNLHTHISGNTVHTPSSTKNTYQRTHWNGSQCRRLGNCTQHTRSQWTLRCLEREAVLFRQRHGKQTQHDYVVFFPFYYSEC